MPNRTQLDRLASATEMGWRWKCGLSLSPLRPPIMHCLGSGSSHKETTCCNITSLLYGGSLGRCTRRSVALKAFRMQSCRSFQQATLVGDATKILQVQNALPFKKYQGLGNDFILIDNRDSCDPKISPEQAKKLCDRNFGIGADGVIFAMPGINGSDYTMRIFNSDGSEPEMCGNGIRCLARFVAELENVKEARRYTIHTLSGPIVPVLRVDGQVEVDMGPPVLNAVDVPTKLPSNKDGFVIKQPLIVEGKTWFVTCVSMGNPHCVVFASEDKEELDVNFMPLESIGPYFEHHAVFPSRTNTEFVQVLSSSHLRMRVWERGAGATLACGTGACAVVVAAVLEGRAKKKCTVDLPGGPLEIEWREDNHVYMTGPAQAVFEGKAFL